MASEVTFHSSLTGLVKIFIDNHGETEGAPGTAYFEFNNYEDTELACKGASKSWELYCVKPVPKDIENGKCFGFAVRPAEKGQANINTMVSLIKKINYWMGGTSEEEDKQIPVDNIDRARLKDRDFNVPQKNYDYLEYFGLKPAIQDPYQEPQEEGSDEINKHLEAFASSMPNIDQNQHTGSQASKKLVADLEKHPFSKQRNEIIEKAKQGYYSDFKSRIPMPKIQLVLDLNAAGLEQLAEQTTDGKYDD